MTQSNSHPITVEVAYALPQEQLIIPLKVNEGCTAEEAVKLSGILQNFLASMPTHSNWGFLAS